MYRREMRRSAIPGRVASPDNYFAANTCTGSAAHAGNGTCILLLPAASIA
jgi:hypothetical protein